MQAATATPAFAGLAHDPALLTDVSVTGVLIQFFSTNRNIISHRLGRLHEPNKARKHNASTQIISETPEVSLNSFIDDLEASGFVLADGFSYERPPQSDSKFDKTTYAMRFQFFPARTHKFESEGSHKRVENVLMPVFSNLVSSAFWQVGAWNNAQASGHNAIGIKCGARIPLRGPNGEALVRRLKDKDGTAYGDPVPFVPAKMLRVVKERLVLV